MPFFDTTDGTSLFYATAGAADGRCVVFAHAWGLNSGMWHYQVPAFLEAGLKCVLFDRRGHGRSDLPGQGYDLDRLADDLADLLIHLDARDVVLVGHSLGAAETVRYLTRHGAERIAGIVLSAPTTPFELRTEDNPDGPIPLASAEAMWALLRRDVGAFVEAVSGADYFGAEYPISATLGDWTRSQIVNTHPQVLVSTSRSRITSDQREEFAGITCPALVVHGDADRSAPIDVTGRKTHSLLPQSKLVIVPGAGHGVYLSDSDRYNKELLAFIDALPG
ncbi:alpha/beta fold hydrolase [Pseudonocardia spinosispora]|uniref:alpha/beta fold hydrolase n=1 Tax=Pseudonocardia spinosispora TaxID=103441 RepID=UPI00048E46C7|nr:alpha/beta hydrolase [Pseudonocardia spinosispora]